MSVLCLSDNDIIHKLAVCDLLDDAVAALGLAPSEVYVLPSARGKLRKLISKKYGAVILQRLELFLDSVQVIDWAIPPAEQRLFEDTMGIDPGEAILYSATAQLEEFLLATGDKTSLRALVNSPPCQPVVQRLSGHILCLEQIIQRCIEHAGFDHVKDKVVPARACDTALRAVFGSGLLATAESVQDNLDRYISDLRCQTLGLLLP